MRDSHRDCRAGRACDRERAGLCGRCVALRRECCDSVLHGALSKKESWSFGVADCPSIVVVAMICLPCSGNLARAVAMQKRWRLPASELPALGFDAARIAGIEARLEEILARAQQFLAEDSAEYRLVGAQLQLVRSRLNERQ